MNFKALHKITYGLYILCSSSKDRYNGQIINTLNQVAAAPPLFTVAVNKLNFTHKLVEESKKFSISILEQDATLEFIGHFGFKSGETFDKFKDIPYKYTVSKNNVPVILDYTTSTLEFEVYNQIDAETHTVYFSNLIDCQVISNKEPLTYAYYHQVKNGITPERSPLYIESEEKKPDTKASDISDNKYKCPICGYIYNPEFGDSERNIPVGTSFEELPDNWCCPLCATKKENFVKID